MLKHFFVEDTKTKFKKTDLMYNVNQFNSEFRKNISAISLTVPRDSPGSHLHVNFDGFAKMSSKPTICRKPRKLISIDAHNMKQYKDNDFKFYFEGYVKMSTIAMLFIRSPWNQAVMSIQGNYRTMNMPYIRNPQGILSIPFSPESNKRFDQAIPVTVMIYCVDAVHESEFENQKLHVMSLYNAAHAVQIALKRYIQLDNVRIRSPTKKDVKETYKNLNLALNAATLETPDGLNQKIMDVIQYITIQKFDTIKSIDDFCSLHKLSFTVNSTRSYTENFIAFRTFLSMIIPLRLSVCDGQHRVFATIVANELMKPMNKVPHVTLRYRNKLELSADCEIFRDSRVNFLIGDNFEEHWVRLQEFSHQRNTAAMNHMGDTFAKLVHGNLTKLMSPQFKYTFVNFRNKVFSFKWTSDKIEEFLSIVKMELLPIVTMIRDGNTYNDIKTIVASRWAEKASTKVKVPYFDKHVATTIWSDSSLSPLIRFKTKGNVRMEAPLDIYFHPYILSMLSLDTVSCSSRIYNNNFEMFQEEGLHYDVRNHDSSIARFMYYAVVRPINYLTHLVQKVIECRVHLCKLLAPLNEAKNKLKEDFFQEHGYDCLPDFLEELDDYIPFSLYHPIVYKQVDCFHFRDMDSETSEFKHLKSSMFKVPPIEVTDDEPPQTIDYDFPDEVAVKLEQLRENKAFIQSKHKNNLRLTIRTIITEDIFSAVAKYGPNPKLPYDIDDATKQLMRKIKCLAMVGVVIQNDPVNNLTEMLIYGYLYHIRSAFGDNEWPFNDTVTNFTSSELSKRAMFNITLKNMELKPSFNDVMSWILNKEEGPKTLTNLLTFAAKMMPKKARVLMVKAEEINLISTHYNMDVDFKNPLAIAKVLSDKKAFDCYGDYFTLKIKPRALKDHKEGKISLKTLCNDYAKAVLEMDEEKNAADGAEANLNVIQVSAVNDGITVSPLSGAVNSEKSKNVAGRQTMVPKNSSTVTCEDNEDEERINRQLFKSVANPPSPENNPFVGKNNKKKKRSKRKSTPKKPAPKDATASESESGPEYPRIPKRAKASQNLSTAARVSLEDDETTITQHTSKAVSVTEASKKRAATELDGSSAKKARTPKSSNTGSKNTTNQDESDEEEAIEHDLIDNPKKKKAAPSSPSLTRSPPKNPSKKPAPKKTGAKKKDRR